MAGEEDPHGMSFLEFVEIFDLETTGINGSETGFDMELEESADNSSSLFLCIIQHMVRKETIFTQEIQTYNSELISAMSALANDMSSNESPPLSSWVAIDCFGASPKSNKSKSTINDYTVSDKT